MNGLALIPASVRLRRVSLMCLAKAMIANTVPAARQVMANERPT